MYLARLMVHYLREEECCQRRTLRINCWCLMQQQRPRRILRMPRRGCYSLQCRTEAPVPFVQSLRHEHEHKRFGFTTGYVVQGAKPREVKHIQDSIVKHLKTAQGKTLSRTI